MDIYLDYNATTPVDPEVKEAMLPFIDELYGNPSSIHKQGIQAKMAIEKARKQVASLIHCSPHEIIFTSGGTESNNYAIKGMAYTLKEKGNHIITTQIEHPAVLEVCKYLEKNGFEVSYLPVDSTGLISTEILEKTIRPETILISIMHANNEIGTIQPIEEIAAITQRHHIVFHSDAAQSCGKVETDVRNGPDLLSIAGHKLYAPKGVGALYVKEGLCPEKLMHGADHERNMRPGTENVLEIVGLGKACEIANKNLDANYSHMKQLRDKLYENIHSAIPQSHLNGHPNKRLPNTLSISFPNTEANLILNEMMDRGIAASAGAACHTDSIDISKVLTAIQLEEHYAMGTLRFSTGRYNTIEEIEQASKIIIEIVRRLSPEASAIKTVQPHTDIKLTHYTQGMGCACKLRPQELEKLLKTLPISTDPNILIDARNSDDAAVYKINEYTALVQTLDFFTPIVDDPYTFGAVAAANALSDIYAMGAIPLFALNIVGFPSSRLPMDILNQILNGAKDKAREAGISILGGHTIDDNEPKFGMVVTGTVHPDQILHNSTARESDILILTKPIGTGILATAAKRGLVQPETVKKMNQLMAELNKTAADIIRQYPVSACTDVTGFGLLGHLSEMTASSKLDAEIILDQVPLIPETLEFASADIIPGGTKDNLAYLDQVAIWDPSIGSVYKHILSDAQTSGGLLFSIPANYRDQILNDLHQAGVKESSVIGHFKKDRNNKIYITKSTSYE